jgi:hypothetical protein
MKWKQSLIMQVLRRANPDGMGKEATEEGRATQGETKEDKTQAHPGKGRISLAPHQRGLGFLCTIRCTESGGNGAKSTGFVQRVGFVGIS